MSHESRKADQAGQADAGISSGADSSRRRPSGEEAGDDSTPEACTSPDGIEAFRGYRLWRLVAGQLRSHRNDTVWPRGRALAARARLGTAYWREKINSLGVSVALSMITATMGAAVLGILYDSAVALLGGPLPLSRGIAALSVGVSLFVIPVVVHLRRSPPVPCGQSQAHGPGRGCGVEHSGHLRDALAVRRPGLGRPIGAWSGPCTRHSLAVGGYHRA